MLSCPRPCKGQTLVGLPGTLAGERPIPIVKDDRFHGNPRSMINGQSQRRLEPVTFLDVGQEKTV